LDIRELINKGESKIVEFKFIFYRKQDVKQDAKQDAKQTLSTSLLKIMKHIDKYGSINVQETMELLELSKSRSSAILKGMVDNNVVDKVGKSRATKYVLSESAKDDA